MGVFSRGDIIGKIRKAIDDILPVVEDSFSADADAEMWQATQDAAIELSMELPLQLLDISVDTAGTVTTGDDNSGSVLLPEDYLRFVSMSVGGWNGILRNLMEPDGEEEKMQRSAWTRGTASKPKAVLRFNDAGKRQLTWWPNGSSYVLEYVAVPNATDDKITCSLREEAMRLLVWRAASIYFEGKKEDAMAEKFRNLSTNY